MLDFYADWCGPCQAMKPIFEQIEKEYHGKIEFKKVDVEAEGQLSAQYGISSIPTYVIVKDGREVARKSGAMPRDSLKSWLDANAK